jgi:hypothetical protein
VRRVRPHFRFIKGSQRGASLSQQRKHHSLKVWLNSQCRHQVAIISLKGRSLSALAELSSLGGPSDTEDSFRNALQSLSGCAVELRWRLLEIITFDPPTLPFRREKQMFVPHL